MQQTDLASIENIIHAPSGSRPGSITDANMQPLPATTGTPTVKGIQEDVTTLKQQNATLSEKQDVAAVKANASASAARLLDQRHTKCQYRSNALTFFAGLVSLARAPRISDSVKFLNLAAPLPFSDCEKAVDANVSTMVVPATIQLMAGSTGTVQVLEGGYTGAFSLTPVRADVLDVVPAKAPDGKERRDTFVVSVKSPETVKSNVETAITVRDEFGQLKTIGVTVMPKPAV